MARAKDGDNLVGMAGFILRREFTLAAMDWAYIRSQACVLSSQTRGVPVEWIISRADERLAQPLNLILKPWQSAIHVLRDNDTCRPAEQPASRGAEALMGSVVLEVASTDRATSMTLAWGRDIQLR